MTTRNNVKVIELENFKELISKLECSYLSDDMISELQDSPGYLSYDKILFYGQFLKVIDPTTISDELKQCAVTYIEWCN